MSLGFQGKPVRILRLAVVMLLSCSGSAHAQSVNPDLAAQAKKDGALVWYTTLSVPEAKEFAAGFEKVHPSIHIEIFRSGAGAIANRIFSEYAAKNDRFDVVQGISSRGVIPAFRRRGII